VTGATVLRSARTEDLDAAARDAVVRLCIAAHDNDDFTRLFTFIPSGGLHVLAFRGSELVAHAVATTRWLQPAGLPLLRTAYVDAVATLPAFQGLGDGSAVLRQLAHDVDSNFAIGCLETERVGFYERLGWVLWRGPLAGRDGNRLVPTPDQSGIMVLRLSATPPLDLDAILTIECQPGRIW
jgi:aminoglycoside 2'-N-acetyltransferase I